MSGKRGARSSTFEVTQSVALRFEKFDNFLDFWITAVNSTIQPRLSEHGFCPHEEKKTKTITSQRTDEPDTSHVNDSDSQSIDAMDGSFPMPVASRRERGEEIENAAEGHRVKTGDVIGRRIEPSRALGRLDPNLAESEPANRLTAHDWCSLV